MAKGNRELEGTIHCNQFYAPKYILALYHKLRFLEIFCMTLFIVNTDG